ncbi:MAG: hypothetical protein JJ910_14995, partial [Maricaulis sp.]|nr:hypothetical protein [Maricaulis sp.]
MRNYRPEAAEKHLNDLTGGPRHQPSKYVAGYKLDNGLALALERKVGNVWLQLQPPDGIDAAVTEYPPNKSRHSNINSTHAPELKLGQRAWKALPKSLESLDELFHWYSGLSAESRAKGPEGTPLSEVALRTDTATFLVKIHATKCPAENDRPRSSADWEAGWFNVPATVSTTGGRRRDLQAPAAGDTVYVWVHEQEEGSNGHGLTAQGTVASTRPAGPDDIELSLGEVALLDQPSYLGNSEIKADGRRRSAIADWVARHPHRQTLRLTNAEANEWQGYLNERKTRLDNEVASAANRDLAVSNTNRDLNKAAIIQKTMEVTVRPGQAKFRDRVL